MTAAMKAPTQDAIQDATKNATKNAKKDAMTDSPPPTRHLDLGCGAIPRNPYRRAQVFGVDISPPPAGQVAQGATVVQANLALQGIPFPDAHFDSVSAYDFIEHMPRVLAAADGQGLRLPFIELMNEISRVLKPGGLFYALTPAYPAAVAFADPTHVNVITAQSHIYFTGPQPLGRIYGFRGQFELRRADWVVYRDALDPGARLDASQRLRRFLYRVKNKYSYLAWEFARAPVG